MHPRRPANSTGDDITDELYHYCTARENVTSVIAKEPSLTPGEAWEQLYGKGRRRHRGDRKTGDGTSSGHVTPSERSASLNRLAVLGNWETTQPSDLFLKMYGDSLKAIDGRVDQAVVSPSLMATSGTVPLTIIST